MIKDKSKAVDHVGAALVCGSAAASQARAGGVFTFQCFDKDGNLCGDVDYESVEPVVDAITPVPGGLGSVTTSITMEHTVSAAEKTIR